MNGNVGAAKQLRRNQTDAERVLWLRLRNRRLNDLKFKRQVPIADTSLIFVVPMLASSSTSTEDSTRHEPLKT
jgi:very-short-patch-repair endonuclease